MRSGAMVKGWMRLAVPALLALMPGAARAQAPAPPPAAGTLLVGNKGENTLSFIDLASGRELGRAATGPMPHEIAVSPDGRRAAVVAYGGRGIDIFDVGTRAKLWTIDLSPNAGPHGIVWLADGRILATAERSQSLVLVDPARGFAVSAIATGQQGTHMVAVSPDARRAYSADIGSGTVTIVDLAAGRKLRSFSLGGAPEGIALSPDGRTLWIADNDAARVQAFDALAMEAADSRLAPVVDISYAVADATPAQVEETVTRPLEGALRQMAGAGEINSMVRENGGSTALMLAPGTPLPAMEAVLARVRAASGTFPQGRTEIVPRILSGPPLVRVATGPVPIRVAASPDGRWIVTSNMGDGTLTVIDARTRRVSRTIRVSGERAAGQVTILFSADGRRLYAAETGRNQVAEVDFESGRVLRRLAAGAQGDGLAIAR
ncbi:MAG TPA: YncE family protein [Allosphingosinicella sp.]|nr:YncE family protein [Allosphingosinicella sp.]